MSVHRISIEAASIAAIQVSPTWSGEVEHSRDGDSVYLRGKAVGDFRFKSEEYSAIKAVPDCEAISIWLDEKCGGDWEERWRGVFTTYDVKFDDNKCLASVAPKIVDAYGCLFDGWEVDQVVAGASEVVTARPFGGVYEAGVGCCEGCFPSEPAQVCDAPEFHCLDGNYDLGIDEFLCGATEHLWSTCFHRVVGQGTPTDPPAYGTGWIHISGNDWWRCPDGTEIEIGVFDQGREFGAVLELLLDLTGCGLILKSHFLGISADHAAPPSNDAYAFSDANYQAIQLHQKSDIKRPDATNPAQSFVWKMSLKKLLSDLETMWNVFWKIDGDNFILEHISYFEAAAGLDMTQTNIRLEYGKQEGGAPKEEIFKWTDRDATFTTAHQGYPINYGECGDGRKEYRLNYFSNDVAYIRTVENQEEIADAGFCLIATEVIDGANTIIDNNNPLGWVAIHENLHKHNRYFPAGNMNDTPETPFLTVKKTRKLEPFKRVVCCDDGFDPADTIATLAGDATVQKATVSYFAGAESNLVTIEANV